jgi:hypothetical protein
MQVEEHLEETILISHSDEEEPMQVVPLWFYCTFEQSAVQNPLLQKCIYIFFIAAEVHVQISAAVVFVICIMLIKPLWISSTFQLTNELLLKFF